jgi:hypothetical protein
MVAQCIGITGQFAVVRDFFGYVTGAPQPLSLLTQVRLLQGKHVHLNLIRTYPFTSAQFRTIDQAVLGMRGIYGTVGIGVGRVKHYGLGAGGYEIIPDHAIATDLADSYSGPGDAIDVFVVLAITGPSVGISPQDGSCDKDDKDSGVVVGLLDNQTLLGAAMAHEVCHFLGLPHAANADNLMYEKDAGGRGLSRGQAGAMKLHCSMRSGCPS